MNYWAQDYTRWLEQREKEGRIKDLMVVKHEDGSINCFFTTIKPMQEQCVSLDTLNNKAFLTPLGPINKG